jgi:flagellar motor switch protein FliG
MSAEGITNSAILLFSLGEELAAEVFKQLDPKEVRTLGGAMAKLGNITREQIDQVVNDYEAEAVNHTSFGGGNDAYVRNVITRALGEDKAGFLLSHIVKDKGAQGIDTLNWMDAEMVSELIQNEHPQIIASILVHLERDTAADVLKRLPERLRTDATLRIATLDGIQPVALRELNEVLSKLLSGKEGKQKSLGGTRAAAEILNYLGDGVDTAIIEAIKASDEKLSQQIVDEMFLFENLLEVDDKGIQLIMRDVQSETLVVALKGADEALREKILKNMSSRAADTLRDDLSSLGPVRVSEVETAQKEMLKVARQLADDGQIVLGGGGGDSFI